MFEPMREIQRFYRWAPALPLDWTPALEFDRAETYARETCVWPEDFEPTHWDFFFHADGRVIVAGLQGDPERVFVADCPAEVLA